VLFGWSACVLLLPRLVRARRLSSDPRASGAAA
jgi:hypothetical protein